MGSLNCNVNKFLNFPDFAFSSLIWIICPEFDSFVAVCASILYSLTIIDVSCPVNEHFDHCFRLQNGGQSKTIMGPGKFQVSDIS